MNLTKKKELAKKTLGVGKNRIMFNKQGISEIKEAITKEDIRNLYKDGIISIKPIRGRRKIERRKRKRGPGKIKKRINKRKQIYVKITRKLRSYIKELKNRNMIDNDTYKDLRKKIRMKDFKSKANLREYLTNTASLASLSEKKVKKSEKKETKNKTKTQKKAKITKTKKESGGKSKK